MPGAFFTGTTFPSGDKVKLDSETASKQGKSSCYSVFALVAFGDCSINSAMKHGGITKIHHVDSSSMNVLYFFFKYDTIVYGEWRAANSGPEILLLLLKALISISAPFSATNVTYQIKIVNWAKS